MTPWLERHGVHVPHSTTEWMARFGSDASSLAGSAIAPAGGVLTTILGAILTVVGSAAAVMIVPVLAIYLLNDFDRITAGVRDLLPTRYRERVTRCAREVDFALTQFIRGQRTVMGIMALLYSVAYAVLGVRLAIVIGMAAGLLNFIPYLGSAFALVAGLSMSLLGGWHPSQLVGVVIAYAAAQSFESFVITPRIVGARRLRATSIRPSSRNGWKRRLYRTGQHRRIAHDRGSARLAGACRAVLVLHWRAPSVAPITQDD